MTDNFNPTMHYLVGPINRHQLEQREWAGTMVPYEVTVPNGMHGNQKDGLELTWYLRLLLKLNVYVCVRALWWEFLSLWPQLKTHFVRIVQLEVDDFRRLLLLYVLLMWIFVDETIVEAFSFLTIMLVKVDILCVNLIDSPVLVGVGSLIKTHMGAGVDHCTPSRVIVVDDYNVFRILRYYVNQEWVEVVRFNHAPFFVRDTFSDMLFLLI